MSTPKRKTIAAALIVKNESKHLKECLETVFEWVDEIIILDSGSTDETEAIARQYTDKFYISENWPGFGPQRQLAQSYVESDYVLWLDADERVTDELKQDILFAVGENKPQTCYAFNRRTTAFGKFIEHSGWSPDWVTRLYPTSLTKYNDSLVHESVVISKEMQVSRLKGRLLHYTFDSLPKYTRKTQQYAQLWADQREGKKPASLMAACTHSLARFLKMYVIKRGFLDGKHGFLLAVLSAQTVFIRYADLWVRDYVKHSKLRK